MVIFTGWILSRKYMYAVDKTEAFGAIAVTGSNGRMLSLSSDA